jgi:hypothetical protein
MSNQKVFFSRLNEHNYIISIERSSEGVTSLSDLWIGDYLLVLS